jgi:hypothetical protein
VLTTFLCLRALVGDDSGTVPVPGVVHKGHMRVIEGMIELINKGKYELQSDLLEFIPEITTRSSEHHAHAVMVVVQVCALNLLHAASFLVFLSIVAYILTKSSPVPGVAQ